MVGLPLPERLAAALKPKVRGEIRFDDLARSLYATDASPYEIPPYGVVIPKDANDVRAVLEVAHDFGVPVLPRGGGTSLAGQTVGTAIVVDFSKYMNQVINFDHEHRRVRVQPGIVRDELNRLLAPHNLHFTPDISPTNRANVGGMVANNSSGTRSIKYGKTIDQVLAITVMLANGAIIELRELDAAELQEKLAKTDTEGEIYRTVHRIASELGNEIIDRYPKVMRRVGGYNLDEFVAGKPFNLAKLVTGSEGTLAFILDVTLKVHPIPNHRILALAHFDTLQKALESVQHINRHGPSAVEIMDDVLFELGLENPTLAPLLGWLNGEPAAVMMIEFDGATEAETHRGLNALTSDPEVQRLSYHTHVAKTEDQQTEILEFRRAGLGTYATIKGNRKPVPFIEDAAIPVENLPRYIPEVLALCEKRGVEAVIYAHASVGVIHVRPLLDLKNETDISLFQEISLETFKLVKRYGGSWSGEHGDGLIRSYQNRSLFGDTIYQAFQEIKRAFDPETLMNPGKIIDAPEMTENLRYGPGYPEDTVQTVFDFSDSGGYLGAIEMCSGVGACRKVGTGTMCPSYMVTRDEDHSTRGRANVLREAITGRMPGGLTSREVFNVLDLCLECKACKAECPSQVDMAKIKYEFLQQYYDDHGTPLSVQAIGGVARAAPLGQAFAPLANMLMPLKPIRWAIEKAVGIDRRRVLPRYSNRSFAKWFKDRTDPAGGISTNSVALVADTWTMFNEPHIGQAATRVLEGLGYRVELVPYGCCGRPLISKGLLRQARTQAKKNLDLIKPFVRRGIPIVGLEPSCVTAYRDDYLDLVPGARSEAVSGQVRMIDEFLAKAWTSGQIDPKRAFMSNSVPILLHGHCQQKAVLGTSPTKAVLEWLSNDVREVDAGCCGMAGSFGYTHYDLSLEIGEQRLFPEIRAHNGNAIACGFSCRHQIRDGTGIRARHLVEALDEALI
jgi:FAD/FMN-containing dehydrogenase/Fe-S oxidoreductase